MYSEAVDVAVTELRARLSVWLDLARHGEEVVITDRGVPVARLLGLASTATLERLTDEGVIARPSAQRPRAAGRERPRPRQPVADIVSEQRD
jgi:prevent-host-death family protein